HHRHHRRHSNCPAHGQTMGERARQMTFVLVGAGATGVELAASFAHMVHVTLRNNFRRIDQTKASIIVLDAGDRALPTFVEPLSRRVTRRLSQIGVKVLTGVKVETVDQLGVVAGGKMLGTKTGRGWRSLTRSCRSWMRPVYSSSVTRRRSHKTVAQAGVQKGQEVRRVVAEEVKGPEGRTSFGVFY